MWRTEGSELRREIGRGWQIGKGGNNGDKLWNSSNRGGSITGGSETSKTAPQGGNIGSYVTLYANRIMK